MNLTQIFSREHLNQFNSVSPIPAINPQPNFSFFFFFNFIVHYDLLQSSMFIITYRSSCSDPRATLSLDWENTTQR